MKKYIRTIIKNDLVLFKENPKNLSLFRLDMDFWVRTFDAIRIIGFWIFNSC